MHMAVTGEVAVVAVDHRDARADETRDRKHRNAGSERERAVGVAQFIESADRFDAGGDLRGPPVPAAKTRKSIRPPPAFGNRIGLTEAGSRSSASTTFACSGTARVLSRVFVFLTLPFANARRT